MATVTLSKRELEVLTALKDGTEAKDVAEMLGCAKRTIDFHEASIRHKFNVGNRIQAIRKAEALGLF